MDFAVGIDNSSPQEMILKSSKNNSRSDSFGEFKFFTSLMAGDQIDSGNNVESALINGSCIENLNSNNRRYQLNFSVDKILGKNLNDKQTEILDSECLICPSVRDITSDSVCSRSPVRPTPIRATEENVLAHYLFAPRITTERYYKCTLPLNTKISNKLFHYKDTQPHQLLSTTNTQPIGAGKRKRSWSRAVFSNLQRKGLEIQFQLQKYITKPDRRKLAARLNLTDAQVKVWFQNRRMKWRHTREHLKSSQEKQNDQTQIQSEYQTSSEDEIDVVTE